MRERPISKRLHNAESPATPTLQVGMWRVLLIKHIILHQIIICWLILACATYTEFPIVDNTTCGCLTHHAHCLMSQLTINYPRTVNDPTGSYLTVNYPVLNCPMADYLRSYGRSSHRRLSHGRLFYGGLSHSRLTSPTAWYPTAWYPTVGCLTSDCPMVSIMQTYIHSATQRGHE